jgi:hypothetical protein
MVTTALPPMTAAIRFTVFCLYEFIAGLHFMVIAVSLLRCGEPRESAGEFQ